MIIAKYKPKTLEELVLPDRIKNLFKNGLNNNYLFYSGGGTGKTSTALVLSQGYEKLFVNASEDSSVDNLKNDIIKFCSSAPVGSIHDKKLVILDEIDGVSLQYKKALRGVMNDYLGKVYFILTCNAPQGDDFFTAIKSRCIPVDFSFNNISQKEINNLHIKTITRIVDICEKESVKIDKKAAYLITKKFLPDFRSSLQFISSLIDSGIEHIKEEHIYVQSKSTEILDLIFEVKDPVLVHKVIYNDYRNKVNESFQALHTDLIDYIENEKPEYKKYIKHLAITISEWDSKKDTLILPVHALKACIYKLQIILNS